MTVADQSLGIGRQTRTINQWGLIWFFLMAIAAIFYFEDGFTALVEAWGTPEYSYGPLVPLLSAYLFLRHLEVVPPRPDAKRNRVLGVVLAVVALMLGAFGRFVQIPDLSAYAIIIWTAALILISFGWKEGRQFWPAVLHLIYMLPLPGVVYYDLSIYLQGVSSHLGVWFLQVANIPVFLDGNIIDLGVYKLQVAEACSGLRYLFPILSFSFIFSMLYQGPIWHRLILLVAAAPITVFMNSVRIAIAGAVVDHYGTAFVEGLTHFLEGWVIFIVCIIILYIMAWALNLLNPQRTSLANMLDIRFEGLPQQILRLRTISPSKALVGVTLIVLAGAIAWTVVPPRQLVIPERQPFALFPSTVGDWKTGTPQTLAQSVATTLRADDYYSVSLTRPGVAAPVGLFMAWYKDQTTAGTHSPTICLPGSGWEITSLRQITISKNIGDNPPISLNRTIIQNGLDRMMVYYWYEQRGQRIASSYWVRLTVTLSKLMTGRADGALVRLTTPILPDEKDSAAEARLQDAMRAILGPLPRFIPGK